MVKNPPEMQETWAPPLGWEERNGYPIQHSCLGSPKDWAAWWAEELMLLNCGVKHFLHLLNPCL